VAFTDDSEAGMAARRVTRAIAVTLNADERDFLERRVRRRKVAQGDAVRAEIILRAAEGMNNSEIADAVGATRQTVRTWRKRFIEHRLDGLDDEPRCGAPRKIGDDKIEAIVVKTLEEKPKGATHWSTRSMAKASGVSTSSVHRIWRAFSLHPHRTETFKLSTDPQFVEKVRDIVGLYLDPPDKALVICVEPDPGARSHPAAAADAPRPDRAAHARL
jgi:transposase